MGLVSKNHPKIRKDANFVSDLLKTIEDTAWHSQGCALAEPGGPWRLTFAFGRLENLRFFIQIICWEP